MIGLQGCSGSIPGFQWRVRRGRRAVAIETAPLEPYSVLNDADKRAKLLAMLAAYLPISESRWTTPSNVPQATGHFVANGTGVQQFRGEAGLAYGYATLLYATPDLETMLGPPGNQFSRSLLEDHLKQTIRHLCYTNSYKVGASGSWGGDFTKPGDQGSVGAMEMGWAAHIYGKILARRGLALDPDTAAAVKFVVTSQADTLVDDHDPFDKISGNTRAEENAWHSAILALAAAIYDDPNSTWDDRWDAEAKNFSINASSRAADEQDTTSIDGKTVAQWVTTANLSDDFTLTNHSFFHPVYSQAIVQTMFDNQIFYRFVGAGIPAAFRFRIQETWEQVLAPLTTSDGDLLMPAGTDWVTHDYQHIPFLAGIATRVSSGEVASVFESRAINTLAKRQAAQSGSLFGHAEIGYETNVFRNIAQAWWIHDQFGPTSTPTEDGFDALSGLRNDLKHWTDAPSAPMERRIIVNRRPNSLVSMSWGAKPTALVVPSSEAHLDDPVLVQYWAQSGVSEATGDTAYTCDCRPNDGFFSTAGSIGTAPRYFSMTSWSDGTTISSIGEPCPRSPPHSRPLPVWSG